MKLVIVGSRTLEGKDFSKLIPEGVTHIISGGAKGVDTFAMEYARKHGLPITVYFPDYNRYARRAPIVRNRLIVENADCVLAIWDGVSKGTKNTIDYAQSQEKTVLLKVVAAKTAEK